MAATGGVDAKELELVIKGLLISSPTVITANTLERECKNELGYVFPYRKLGFASFLDYLRSIPTVVQLQPPNGYNPQVLPITTKASSHIDQLVSKQRVAPSRRRGVSRRGGYNSRPPPARRRPTGPPAPPPVRPNQGIDVRDLENHLRRNYDERDLARNGVHGVEDLLSRGDHMLERGDTKVYPKLAHEFNNPNQNGRANIMPAGFEDDFDDFDYDDDYYEGNDSEEEMSNQVIQIWSQALGVEENNSSSRPQKPQGNMPNGSQEEESLHYDNQEFPEDDFNISEAMINNFRTILSRHPDGIWASQLQMYYHDYFGATLDFSDLGHNSAISLVASLPTVFTYCREGTHDWKLYDARLVSQEDLDAKVNGSATMSQEKDRYIPQTIIENIKRLLEENINGFRSTDLLSLYSRTFNKALNLDILGFDTLEEFLMILKNDVTLKKSSGYYVLLPKHKLVPHDALLPPKPDDRLNVPAESLGVPIPDFVMKLGDEILMQELPQIMSKDDDTMLMVLDVRVAEVHSPAFFYVMLDQMYEELEKMMDDLDKFYNLEEANLKIPVPYMAPNLYCAALYCGYWHRVKITKIKNPNAVEIEYIDYGTPATVDSSELRYLSKEYVYLPAQAICSKLVGIKPLDGATKFPEPVCAKFLSLVEGKRLVAYVYHLQERVRNKQEKLQIEVVLYDVEPNKEMVINDHLVEIGMAMPIDQIVIGTTDLAKTEEIQPQATDDQMVPPQGSAESPAPPSSDSPLPAYLPKLLENASASRPTTSVNRKMSSTLKRYVVIRYANRDWDRVQYFLEKYTLKKRSAVLGSSDRNSENATNHDKPCTEPGKHSTVLERSDRNSENATNQDKPCTEPGKHSTALESSDCNSGYATDQDKPCTEPVDISSRLEMIKKKRKSYLFAPLKAPVEGNSKPDLPVKEYLNTDSSKHLNRFANDSNCSSLCDKTLDTGGDVKNNVTYSETRTSNGLGTVYSGKTEAYVGPISNGVETHKNDHCVTNGCEVADVGGNSCISDTKTDFKCTKEVQEINVIAISHKLKPHRLKNLFGKPTLLK